MMNKKLISWALLTALCVLPALAGDDDHAKPQCEAEVAVCVRGMVEKLGNRGWIGIEWDPDAKIPTLTNVVAGSPAESAGLLVGDTLLAFNGVATSEGEEAVWKEAKRSLIPGKTIVLTVQRKGATKDVEVLLASLPRAVMAQWIGNHVLEHHVAEIEGEAEVAQAPKP